MSTASHPHIPFGPRDLLVAAMMNVLWGFNIIAAKMAVTSIAPFTAGCLRQVIVFAICASALRIVPGKMVALTTLGILSGGLFYVAINLSLAVSSNVGALAIAGQLGVPFSLLLAIVVLREKVHWPRMAGMALSFLGVLLLVFDPAVANEGLGLVLTAVSSAIWATSSLLQRKLVGVPVLTIFAWIGLWGAITLGALALWLEPDTVRALPNLPLRTLGWVAFSAVGSTILGQGSMAWLLQRHPVSTVIPFTLASPIISVFAATYYFDNPLTGLMLAGGGIAMVGVAIVTIRTARVSET